MSGRRAVRGRVSGRVQGVAYRASFQREAVLRNLTGWVRNRADGSVAFLLQGDADRVQQQLDWAVEGPRFARVDGLAVEEIPFDPDLEGFRVLR